MLQPNRGENEEWQYFVQDLLGLIDILRPVLDLMVRMLRMKSQHYPVCKLKQYWQKVREILCKAEYGIPNVYPMCTYKPIKRLEGWLIS